MRIYFNLLSYSVSVYCNIFFFLIVLFIIIFYIILINNTINLFFSLLYHILLLPSVSSLYSSSSSSSILLIKWFFSDLIGSLQVHVLLSNSNKLHEDLLQEYKGWDQCITTIFILFFSPKHSFLNLFQSFVVKEHICNSVANLQILFSTK